MIGVGKDSQRRVGFLGRAIRFALTGLFVTGIHAVVAYTLIRFLATAPSLANGAAFLVATIVSYLLNTVWSFSAQIRKRTFVKFCVVSAIGFLLAMLVAGAAQALAFDFRIGICAVALTIPPVTFLLHNFWTYR